MANLSTDIINNLVEKHNLTNDVKKGWDVYRSEDQTKALIVKQVKSGVLSEVHLSGYDIETDVGAPPTKRNGKVKRVIKPKKVEDALAAVAAIERAFEVLVDATVLGDKGVRTAKENVETKEKAEVLDYEAIAALKAKALEEELGMVSNEEEVEDEAQNDSVYDLTEDEAACWGDSQTHG